jgi:hypothetical protein
VSRKQRHFELLEASNNARTAEERRLAEAELRGFRDGVVAVTGMEPGLLIMEGDWFYIDRGVDRPMCGGSFLDWAPRGDGGTT